MSFEERAPSAWELSQLGTDQVLYIKDYAHPPVILNGAKDCTATTGLFTEELDWESCGTRQRPDGWDETCPLRVGGTLPCWYAPDPSAAAATYGDISAWDVSLVTDMSDLFSSTNGSG